MITPGSTTTASPPVSRLGVRHAVFACIFAGTFVALVQRVSVSVAAEQMMPALGINQAQIGWIFTAFLIGYTVFQFPGGIFGQKVGARIGLLASILLSTLGTALTAAAYLFTGSPGLMPYLVASRVAAGVGQAPLFPISSGVVRAWFPPYRRASMFGLQITGLSLGAAAAPPAIAGLMQAFGWEIALYAAALPGLVVAAVWWNFGRDTPQDHPAMTASELHEISGSLVREPAPRFHLRDVVGVLKDSRILLLSIAYVLHGVVYYLFVFWTFLYLVQERGFTVLESGWLASVPFITGAVGAAVGGRISDVLCGRIGPRWGFRVVPLIALPAAAALLVLGVSVESPMRAVVLLSFCFGVLNTVEGPLWGAMMWVSREQSMAGGGVLNTGGNIGGIVGTPIIGYLTGTGNWSGAFAFGAACALGGAAVWLFIDASRPGRAGRSSPA